MSEVSVTVTRQDRYRFLVEFDPEMTTTIADEPPPLGTGSGPTPTHLLAAAVANCLSATLVYSFGRYKEDPGAIRATARCTTGRNAQGRMRVQHIDVALALGVDPWGLEHFREALAEFEDFCTVSQSVKAGIPYTLTLTGPDGTPVA